MATFNLTPVLRLIEKNDDCNFIFAYRMVDANGVGHGLRPLFVNATSGVVTDWNGSATGQVLTSAQLTSLSNFWNNAQTLGTNADNAGKFQL